MNKSTFKSISFLGMLNWVTVHSRTEKYVEIIYTPRDRKVKHVRVFQMALKGFGRNLPSQWGDGKFWWGEGFSHQLEKICQGVILTIQTFFKTKNNIL